MAKYMLIMRGTDESNAAVMAGFEELAASTYQFIEELMKAGVFIAAEGLDDAAESVVVDFSGEAPVVTDGPYGETKELFGGYFMLDVASKQEAVEWAKRLPSVTGSKIEVRRVAGEDERPPGHEEPADANAPEASAPGTSAPRADKDGTGEEGIGAVGKDRESEDRAGRESAGRV